MSLSQCQWAGAIFGTPPNILRGCLLMGLLGGWLGPAFQVLNGQQAGQAQGALQGQIKAREWKREDEEWAQKQKMQEMEMALNQARMDELSKPTAPQEWKPTTHEEAVSYFNETHPQKPEATPEYKPKSYKEAVKFYQETHPENGGAGKPPTESERRNASLLTVARQAFPTLQAAEPPGFIESNLSKVGGGNAALSANRQKANQAGAQFYRSYLYVTSGATVNPDEAMEAAKTFTPQFGDKPEVIRQKRQAQKTMMEAMEQAGGRAVTPPHDDPVGRAYSPDNPFANGLP